MLTINTYNYGNNNEPLIINPRLLSYYREECDTYLVDIKRQLTRSLVDYRIFQKLQEIDNSYYVIISKLEEQEYINVNQIEDDKKVLHGIIVEFQKDCKPAISKIIYDDIIDSCNKIMLTLIKLIQIVKIINTHEDKTYFNNNFNNIKKSNNIDNDNNDFYNVNNSDEGVYY